jgi:L,D-transpeptidase catalytic domain
LEELMQKGFVTAALAMLVSSAGAPVVAKTAPASVAHAKAARAAVAAPAGVTLDRALALKSGVNADVLDLALTAVSCGVASGDLEAPTTLTLIDYSLPSTTPRLWVFDLHTGKVLFNELVAHGRNSGDNMATRFSDTAESRESSIGLFRTADTYVGHNGYSLRLDGLEPGFNANARERAIVMHGAPYVDAGVAKANGRLGRSWGCPALREAVARQVIDTVRGGGVIFSYYPDAAWLKASRFLNCPVRPAPATVVARN